MPYDMEDDIEGMFIDGDPAVETATFTVPDPDDLPDGTIELDALCEFIKNVGESAIYDRSFFDKEFYNVVVETSKDWLQLPTNYIPAGVKRNTPVLFRDIQYYVYRAPHDSGHGVSAIFISKDRA